MLHDTKKRTKIDLPEELLCAYVDGTTTPSEDREMLDMLASDKSLAMLHDDLRTVMDIINISEDDDFEILAAPMPGCASLAPEPDECVIASHNMRLEDVQCMIRSEEEKCFEKRDKKMDKSSSQESKHRSIFGKLKKKGEALRQTPHSRVTPFMVRQLAPDEIFVFGSNPWGLHNGGASKLAKTRFGAIQGQAEGRQGQSYAIPTIVGGVENIRPHVNTFLEYAEKHPELHFLVSRVGCGTAGFKPEDIAPLFIKAKSMTNVSLPIEFWQVIGLQ